MTAYRLAVTYTIDAECRTATILRHDKRSRRLLRTYGDITTSSAKRLVRCVRRRARNYYHYTSAYVNGWLYREYADQAS